MSSLPSPFVTISPVSRGLTVGCGALAQGVFRFPTDPIGTTTVTFAGVQAGTEIRVYLPDGTELAGVETCDANHQLTWSVYAPGANSVVTVRLVNTAYKIKEFEYTPVVGNQSLPVQQEADKWYSNPV